MLHKVIFLVFCLVGFTSSVCAEQIRVLGAASLKYVS